MKYFIVNAVVSVSVLNLGCSMASADQALFKAKDVLESRVNKDLESISSSSLYASASRVTLEFDIVESGESIKLRLDYNAEEQFFHEMEIVTPWGEFSVLDESLSEFTRPDLFFTVSYSLAGHAEAQSLSGFSLLFSYDPSSTNAEEGCEWLYSDAYISVDQHGVLEIEVERHSESGIEVIFERETQVRESSESVPSSSFKVVSTQMPGKGDCK